MDDPSGTRLGPWPGRRKLRGVWPCWLQGQSRSVTRGCVSPETSFLLPPPRACGLLPVETMGAASAKCLLCWGLSLGPRAWGGRL